MQVQESFHRLQLNNDVILQQQVHLGALCVLVLIFSLGNAGLGRLREVLAVFRSRDF